MRKFILGFVFLILISGGLKAQQDPQYTMFYFNKMLYNPAYAGAKGSICATMLGRFQWNGLPGAPNTFLFTADAPFNLTSDKKNQLGVGLTFYGDYLGYNETYGLKVAGAYRRMGLGPGNLSVGIDLGFQSVNINKPQWVYPDASEPALAALDNVETNSMGFDLSFGAYYNSDRFYAGVSVLHLTGSDFTAINVRQARHMYFTGGYTFDLGNSNWQLNPNAIIRTDFATANFDINCNAIYDFDGSNKIFFGATYRYIDAIGVDVGYMTSFGKVINGKKSMGMMIGYNYDINTSRLNSFNSGSHEVILRFCFSIEREKLIIKQYINRFGDSMQNRY